MKYMYWVFWMADGDTQDAYFTDKQAAEFFIECMKKNGFRVYLNKYTWSVEIEQ